MIRLQNILCTYTIVDWSTHDNPVIHYLAPAPDDDGTSARTQSASTQTSLQEIPFPHLIDFPRHRAQACALQQTSPLILRSEILIVDFLNF